MKRSEQTEKKIIQAALELFVQKGYHGTSISDITKSVGLTKGALYSHFTSKSELLHRILGEFKADFLDTMIRRVNESQGDAMTKLNRAISFNAYYATKRPELVVFLTFLSHELSADADFEFGLKNLYREYQKFIGDLIRQGVRQGLFKSDLDPDLVALTYMGIHDGILHHWVLNRNSLDGRQYVKTLRRIFLEGLKA